jgi:hypothetical protein
MSLTPISFLLLILWTSAWGVLPDLRHGNDYWYRDPSKDSIRPLRNRDQICTKLPRVELKAMRNAQTQCEPTFSSYLKCRAKVKGASVVFFSNRSECEGEYLRDWFRSSSKCHDDYDCVLVNHGCTARAINVNYQEELETWIKANRESCSREEIFNANWYQVSDISRCLVRVKPRVTHIVRKK